MARGGEEGLGAAEVEGVDFSGDLKGAARAREAAERRRRLGGGGGILIGF